jgi:hypothetical protein
VRWKEDVLTAFMGTAAVICSRVCDRGLFASNRFPSQSPERPRIYGAILEQKERRLPFSSY